MDNFLGRIRSRLRHPGKGWRQRQEWRRLEVNSETRIIIEGFPRSANTFAVVAFQQAQERDMVVAHHHHRVEQVIKGVERGIPVCVLIRDPVDATKSAVLRDPSDINDSLARYIYFYKKAWPARNGFVIAPFEDVTKDFGAIIGRINAKFDTDFSIFRHTKENCRKVFGVLDELNSRLHQGNAERSSTPNSRRTEVLRNMNVALDPDLLSEARTLYEQYLVKAREPEQ